MLSEPTVFIEFQMVAEVHCKEGIATLHVNNAPELI